MAPWHLNPQCWKWVSLLCIYRCMCAYWKVCVCVFINVCTCRYLKFSGGDSRAKKHVGWPSLKCVFYKSFVLFKGINIVQIMSLSCVTWRNSWFVRQKGIFRKWVNCRYFSRCCVEVRNSRILTTLSQKYSFSLTDDVSVFSVALQQ